MYYEVYVDVLFVENLCMNAMLLLLTAWWDQAEIKVLRTVAAAALGSLGACVLVVVSDCFWDQPLWQQGWYSWLLGTKGTLFFECCACICRVLC